MSDTTSRLHQLLKKAWDEHASDVHLREEEPALLRLDGELRHIGELVTDRNEIEEFILPLMNPHQAEEYRNSREHDFACEIKGICRLRLNAFIQRQKRCVSIRLLPETIPTMEDIYLPKACEHFTQLKKGLVLATGPTGSGKSTTLAAMIERINNTRGCHILTVEDPIEFIYTSKTAMISQREIGDDTANFGDALRAAFRQDPDVVLLGEMRDLETMQIAITMAETGHLTFSTLHTGEASQTVSRVVDSFPPHQQESVRMQLSNSLAGIISQQLLPLKDQTGRVAAREVLVNNRGVANLIRENKLEQIQTAIQTGSNDMMFTMNHSLGHLLKSGYVTYEDAFQASFDKRDFKAKFESMQAD